MRKILLSSACIALVAIPTAASAQFGALRDAARDVENAADDARQTAETAQAVVETVEAIADGDIEDAAETLGQCAAATATEAALTGQLDRSAEDHAEVAAECVVTEATLAE